MCGIGGFGFWYLVLCLLLLAAKITGTGGQRGCSIEPASQPAMDELVLGASFVAMVVEMRGLRNSTMNLQNDDCALADVYSQSREVPVLC